MNFKLFTLAIIASIALAGCSTTSLVNRNTSTSVSEWKTGYEPWNDPKNPLFQKTIYFAVNDFELDDKGIAISNAHGSFLAKHPNLKVKIIGYADERGSKSYNRYLGETRANEVKNQMFMSSLVLDSQLKVMTFGEDKPIITGHNEKVWSKNRRVEIVYEN